mgnify:CR=1 FL=1
MSLALEVKNLCLSYDFSKEMTDEERRWIFRDLSFQMKPGELILMTGPSGCGNIIENDLLPRVLKHAANRPCPLTNSTVCDLLSSDIDISANVSLLKMRDYTVEHIH